MTITVKTTISTKILKKSLFQGSCIAIAGVSLLLLGGILFSLTLLQKTGLFLFLLSSSCITLGLLPYRKYSQMQLNPPSLIREENTIEYYHKGKKIMMVPVQSIIKHAYVDDPLGYGILLSCKMQGSSPIIVYREIALIEKMRKEAAQWNGTLFFPFFNRRAYDHLFTNLVVEDSI